MLNPQNPQTGDVLVINDVEIIAYKQRGRRIIITNVIIFVIYNTLILINRLKNSGNSIPVAPTSEQLNNASNLDLYVDSLLKIKGYSIWNRHMLILGALAILFFIVDAIRRKKNGGVLYLYALGVIFFIGILSAFVGFMESSF